MQEYIIYAIFIFFPIGILMNFLLRRQGLILKYRLIIITASLVIIISFPILMGNLGLPIALLLYVSAILALTWFFIKATQSHAWYLSQGVSANDEVYVSDRFIDMTKVQTVGDLEDAIWPKESDNEDMDASIDMSNSDTDINDNRLDKTETLLENDSVTETTDERRNNELLSQEINYIQEVKTDVQYTIAAVDTDDIVDPAGEQAEYLSAFVDQNAVPEDEEHIIMEALYINDELPKLEPDHADEIIINEAEVNIESLSDLPSKSMELSVQTTSLEAETELSDEDAPVPEKEIAASLDSSTIDQDLSAELELIIDSEGHMDESLPTFTEPLAAASLNEIENVDSDPFIDKNHQAELHFEETVKEAPDSISAANVNRENDRINQLIDQAFRLKNESHYMEALDFFAEALDINADEDLSYLLIMEMVNIYKDMGMYARAEELLFLSIGKAHSRTDIIDEIERQLSYIRLLSVELDRLGLANTPISEVPRLVRMNVAEIAQV